MKITSITPIAITIPLRQEIKMGGILYTESENLLVRVKTEDGSIGWGEAAAAPTMTGETIASMDAAIKYLTSHLIGRNVTSFQDNMKLMDHFLYGNSSAKAALEIAFYDVVGKIQQKSMSELLGGVKRSKIPVLLLLADGKLDADREEAQLKLDEGFQSFKIKVGGNPINEDVSRVEEIRKIVGKSRQLSVDANQAWERTEAIRFVERVSGLLDFIEQPVMGNDLDGMKSIAQASSAPIGADEGLHSISDIMAHKESGAAAGGSLKMIKLGGVTKALKAAELSDQVGMKVNLAGKICETSISSAAVSHLAAAIPQIDWGLSITNQYAAVDIVKEPVGILNGNVSVPSGYGLGVEMDEVSLERLSKHAIRDD